MVNRKRKTLEKPVTSINFVGMSLKEVAERVNELIELYGEDSAVDMYQPMYEDTEYQYVFRYVPETDEEMQSRIDKEENSEKKALLKERALYEEMRKKYG